MPKTNAGDTSVPQKRAGTKDPIVPPASGGGTGTIGGLIDEVRKEISDSEAKPKTGEDKESKTTVVIGIDKQRFDDLWLKLANMLPAKDAYLKSIMLQPYEIEGDTVVVSILNDMQRSISNQVELVKKLREVLDNPQITIATKLVDSEAIKGKQAFTNKEKLGKMMEHVAAVKTLVENFGLQFD